ncbi:MAG: hypothetical protein M3530_08735 [Thermoproteota archaeon]|nr:hypothetical protein [Thermoproteota archaeon]
MSSKKDNTENERHPSIKDTLKKLSSDFQCSVCGAIFTTDEDRKQHLEKEAHGILHEGTTKKRQGDCQTARRRKRDLFSSHMR